MARIAGVNIPVNKHAWIGLTSIYGVGRSSARKICASAGVDPATKVKSLSEAEVERLRAEVGKFTVEGDLRRAVATVVCVIARVCRFVASGRAPMRAPVKARASRSRSKHIHTELENEQGGCRGW